MEVIMLILAFCVFAILIITFFSMSHEVNEYIKANDFLMEKNKTLTEENKALYEKLNNVEKTPKPRGRKPSKKKEEE